LEFSPETAYLAICTALLQAFAALPAFSVSAKRPFDQRHFEGKHRAAAAVLGPDLASAAFENRARDGSPSPVPCGFVVTNASKILASLSAECPPVFELSISAPTLLDDQLPISGHTALRSAPK
jgi:hypothetical protein